MRFSFLPAAQFVDHQHGSACQEQHPQDNQPPASGAEPHPDHQEGDPQKKRQQQRPQADPGPQGHPWGIHSVHGPVHDEAQQEFQQIVHFLLPSQLKRF